MVIKFQGVKMNSHVTEVTNNREVGFGRAVLSYKEPKETLTGVKINEEYLDSIYPQVEEEVIIKKGLFSWLATIYDYFLLK